MRFLVWLSVHTIAACAPRPIRFVMDHRIFKVPLLSWIFKTSKTIPIAPAKENSWIMEHAFIDIAKALHDGELICIFPEGQLTNDGEMKPFKNGIQKILDRTPVPVIPLILRGLWGSIYSRHSGNPFHRKFRRWLFSKLELVVGESVAPDLASPELLQQQVQLLRGQWR